MTKEERAIIKKIEAKFPRDKAQKGETKIEFNGDALGLGRDAREHLDYVLGKLKGLANIGQGSFRIVKVAYASGAAELAGLSEDEQDIACDMDLCFVIPNHTKDPSQEFGPCYTIYFKPE